MNNHLGIGGAHVDTVYSSAWLRRRRTPELEPWAAAARRGEPWALEQFFLTYRTAVQRLCYRFTGSEEDAEDAVQGAFIRAFRELPRFRGASTLKTWLYRIAINEAIRICRRRRPGPEIAAAEVGVPDRTPALVENLMVHQALQRLNPEQRMILVLRFWEGLTAPEIAEVLDITLPAAKMRLHRARAEFRRCYAEEQ